MIRKKIVLFSAAAREITPIASTTSATFTTALPLLIEQSIPGQHEVEAMGVRLLLGVTGRTTGGDLNPLSLNVYLEEQHSDGVWRGVEGSTMTPVVTATTFETLDMGPYISPTATPLRRAFHLPNTLRAVAKLQGSATATPSMTFFLEADLYS